MGIINKGEIMNEKIKQFNTWFNDAKSGDQYTYFTGNLAYSTCRADGFELKELKKYLMDKCCTWNLSTTPLKKNKNNGKIKFNPYIRLVQKGDKKYWDKKEKEILRDSEYIAIKL